MRQLILLIGPTCTGKSTLEKELNQRGVPSVTSFTTRKPRTGEIDGVDYDFLTPTDTSELDATGQIVQSVYFKGNYYGTTQSGLDRAFAKSNLAVVVVEPTGLTQFDRYAESKPDLTIVSVYINNSLKTLISRLLDRWDNDINADPGYYRTRLRGLLEEHAKWPNYEATEWSIYFPVMDHTSDLITVQLAADEILAKYPKN